MNQNETLLGWVSKRGGYINPCLNLFNVFPNGSRGIAATTDIPEAELLILMPMKACIHTLPEEIHEEDPRSSQLRQFVEDLPQSVVPFLRTTLVLMHHLSQGSASPKKAYLETFPQSHDCTLSWNDSEMKALKGTSIQHTGKQMSGEVFRKHIKPALERYPDLFTGMDYDRFEYAAGMVQSRSFRINQENFITGESIEGQELYMIPGIDMLNHSTRPENVNTTLQRRDKTVIKQGDENEDGIDFTGFFAIEAERPIKAGEEVLISYGNLSDAQLLQTYGFVEEIEGFTNPWNFVAVPSSLVAQAARAVQKSARKGRQKRKRQEAGAESVFRITEAEPLPENLLEHVEELAEEEEIIPVLLTLAGMLQEQYEGTQKSDEEWLQRNATCNRLRNAMLVRMGERSLIRRFKEAVIRMLIEDDEDEEGEEDNEEEEESEDEEGD